MSKTPANLTPKRHSGRALGDLLGSVPAVMIVPAGVVVVMVQVRGDRRAPVTTKSTRLLPHCEQTSRRPHSGLGHGRLWPIPTRLLAGVRLAAVTTRFAPHHELQIGRRGIAELQRRASVGHHQRRRRYRPQSSIVVSGPYRVAISTGPGSTWCRQSLDQTTSQTWAVAVLPKVAGGPGSNFISEHKPLREITPARGAGINPPRPPTCAAVAERRIFSQCVSCFTLVDD